MHQAGWQQQQGRGPAAERDGLPFVTLRMTVWMPLVLICQNGFSRFQAQDLHARGVKGSSCFAEVVLSVTLSQHHQQYGFGPNVSLAVLWPDDSCGQPLWAHEHTHTLVQLFTGSCSISRC
jgi:hypothetical protein